MGRASRECEQQDQIANGKSQSNPHDPLGASRLPSVNHPFDGS
jgi:hypothetical protein